mmetsp:Transcript_4312/g.8262  ORF Transcript_4312/g.8262 Transcript_4312/m.8262 type:complete len:615 (-) Transcript_4312:145-1989(-)|eukprot:CAMPEP_0176488252 /NCGR_PEP_ID=MMETSP0200_2-20121128/6604_1 /TAXON_ID=947934 /ORGANISM="Chaetoceros sp., Strain GSL56" /LENGTH=614 /DNA_ID=CAMNT_0017885211 /DNA_START=160 /DNA_END=2004 /DNA_ORIENTATION=+
MTSTATRSRAKEVIHQQHQPQHYYRRMIVSIMVGLSLWQIVCILLQEADLEEGRMYLSSSVVWYWKIVTKTPPAAEQQKEGESPAPATMATRNQHDQYLLSSGIENNSISSSHPSANHGHPSNSSFLSFPRWRGGGVVAKNSGADGGESGGGILIDSIIDYLNYSTQGSNIDFMGDILHPKDFHIPNVLYVFGAVEVNFLLAPAVVDYNNSTTSSGSSTSFNTTANTTKQRTIWVEQKRRQKLKRWIYNSRYKDEEKLLQQALDYLQLDRHHQEEGIVSKDSSYHSSRWKQLKQIVFVQSSKAGIPILLNLADNRHCLDNNFVFPATNTTYNLPVWTLASPIDCLYAFPLPAYSLLQYMDEHNRGNYTEIQQTWHKRYEWKNKKCQVVWRGSLSLNGGGKAEIYKHPRNIMILQAYNHTIKSNCSLNHHNETAHSNCTSTCIFDVSSIAKNERENKRAESLGFPVSERINFEDFQQYKAILDVDGNSWSERFPRLLCMNSVVLKVHPEMVGHIYPMLKPWVHYVPIARDSSDLKNISQWILHPDQDQLLQQIIENANKFCQQYFTQNKAMEYVLDALEFYVQRLNEANPDWHQNWLHAIMHKLVPYSNFDWQHL